MSTDHLTDDDRAFLARPLLGFFTVAAGAHPPQPRPVWFEATPEGTVQIFTGPDTVKVRRLREDPRASLVVAAPASEDEHWVAVAGPTTVETDGTRELVARLGERYVDRTDPARAALLDEMLAGEWVRVVIHPDKVSRFVA